MKANIYKKVNLKPNRSFSSFKQNLVLSSKFNNEV
jgi:hypothetical protein